MSGTADPRQQRDLAAALAQRARGLDAGQVAAGGDPVATRHEALVPLDLPPGGYLAYAHRAVIAAIDYLDRQRAARA